MDNKKLRQFIEFTSELMQKEENSWMFSELLSTLKKDGYLVKGADDAIMLDIYEYCLVENLTKQAESFYINFEPKTINDELVFDFIAMERARRNNDFYKFCLSAYQQIENIINTLFIGIEKDWENNKKNLVENIVLSDDKKKLYKIIKTTKYITEQDLIFKDRSDFNNWYPNRKFCLVMYYFMFGKSFKKYNSLNLYNELSWVFTELYQCRNKVHKGEITLKNYQIDILNRVEANQSQYYFKFYYLLEQFVFKIKENINTKP